MISGPSSKEKGLLLIWPRKKKGTREKRKGERDLDRLLFLQKGGMSRMTRASKVLPCFNKENRFNGLAPTTETSATFRS